MKVAVVGLWHLGSVTAACLAHGGHDVIAYDPVPETIAQLQKGHAPLFEPGLDDLLNTGIQAGKLIYTDTLESLKTAEVVWITFDTPVDANDIADVDYVVRETQKIFPYLQNNALVIVSSQVPVGSTPKLQELCANKTITFAYIPENLRLGKAIEVFTQPDRVVIGLNNLAIKPQMVELLKPFSDNLVWMSVASAEMTKHAINAFLALSVTFINELAALCETVGADAREVEQGLKSEERIGRKAYLRPGCAIGGGTLMRDIHFLTQIGAEQQRATFLFSSIAESNRYHMQWAQRKLEDVLLNLKGKKVAMLGLTYKVGTDTLRRSTAIETCEWLREQGTQITAYDPVIKDLPVELASYIDMKETVAAALQAADAVVISTEWPQFRDVSAEEFVTHLKQSLVIDPGGFVAKNLAGDTRIQYYSVGVPA